jgi:type IV pilus assembly protein PilY1
MKKIQRLILLVAGLMTGYSATLHAEDIDLYADPSTSGNPNVLIVLDNAANFSAGAATCKYVDNTSPSLNGTAGGVEQCAIYNVISALPDNAVNVGIMVFNANNIRDYKNENCGGTEGGCLVYPLTPMTTKGGPNKDINQKQLFLDWVKTWRTTGGSGDGYIKANGESTASTMQEAWAYYAGKTGLSGRNYANAQPPEGCQKNFVVYIGNAFDTNGTPGDGGTASAQAALASAPGITAELKAAIAIPSGSYGTPTFSCGASYTMGNHSGDTTGLYADEWARYMNKTDIYGTYEGAQNITTYTIGFLGTSCKPEYPALLTSAAFHGGGLYFGTSSYDEIVTALLTILNRVQAIESAFSSASLPVSVNADGTYLNQIFLGMFRPDGKGLPRWQGNLKQYQLIKDKTTGRYVMGDSTPFNADGTGGPKPAIDPDNGFIDSEAVSYWTYKDLASAPDKTGGFWVNDQKGDPVSGYDSPDGELVEKGGVAQQLRKENLKADFAAAEYSSTNPRRLYTYCPTGGTVDVPCSANPRLTADANKFSVSNDGISVSAFGASSSIRVQSIVRSGTSATVTTLGDHGFNGKNVTVTGADQSEYNVTQTVSGSGNTFTITGLTDYPTSPSQGAYTLRLADAAYDVSVSSLTYDSATSTVTVQTAAHNFADADDVIIAGASPAVFNGQFVVALPDTASCPKATCFTYAVTQTPPPATINKYQAVVAPPASSINIATLSKVNGAWTITTSSDHGFHPGQRIEVLGTSDVVGNWVVESVSTPKMFSLLQVTGNRNTCYSSCGSVQPSTAAQPISTLARSGTTATATGLPDYYFGFSAGDTKTVNITLLTNNGGINESPYAVTAKITCAVARCNSFTYTVNVSPNSNGSGTIVASPASQTASTVVAAGKITRIGTDLNTVKVVGLPPDMFKPNDVVSLVPTGTPYATSESAYYANKWTVAAACTVADCSELTFQEPATLSPPIHASGTYISAYSGTAPPDKGKLIRWVRGEDNVGDEKGPGNGVTVRGSIHGDVLHSRPVVVNYGGSIGLVAFYGANDGVFRAVNANKKESIGDVPAGDELWGLILPDHFAYLNRLRLNSPYVKFHTTLLPSAREKDYFIDGATGVYQKLDSLGKVEKVYIYLTMRRGGKFIYALDVTAPTDPKVVWKIAAGDSGFEELGQTWSRPRLTLLQGKSTTPVLVFGAGYDVAEDSEPPKADSSGRGIYVVDALSGTRIWSAMKNCGALTNCLSVANMDYAIPSDVTFVDRDNDGYPDTLYFGDLGGNVWRAIVSETSTSAWTVERLAQFGCDTGACTSGTPRKFFYPPSVISVGAYRAAGAYDLVSIPSGDREHPLKSNGSYAVADKFFMVVDRTAANPATPATPETPATHGTIDVTKNQLDQNTSFTLNEITKGFYMNFATGEKGVNAPNSVNGYVFFATNQPKPDSAQSCIANLGTATGYAIDPFTGAATSKVLLGGGLPPSSVAGIVNIETDDGKGNKTTTQEKFCIGCAMNCVGKECSPLENSPPLIPINKNLRRTYWYKK